MENPEESKEEELARICLSNTQQIMGILLDVLSLRNCLIEKSLISEDDLAASREKTLLVAKTAANLIVEARIDKHN
jgi:hypothetical protein